MKRLRIPVVLAFTLVGAACGDDDTPSCQLYCIPDQPIVDAAPLEAGVADATPIDCPPCADSQGTCPAGCRPIG
ncbi:MAG TPA: hypothetical protein VFQ53_29955 [Kofleriaceae bacterium]|nr:hypothetical protein [Kofleriaceae bacterium]